MMLNNYDIFWDKIHNIYQIRSKTDVYTVAFDSEEQKQIFEQVVGILSKSKSKLSQANLIKTLTKKFAKQSVLKVVDQLQEFGLLEFQNGYFNQNTVAKIDSKVLIISASPFAEPLKMAFKAENYTSVNQFNFSKIEVDSDTFDKIDFVVVDGSSWNPDSFDNTNQILTAAKIPWLLVSGLENTDLKIGPIFWGKDLGCYNCLKKRLDSNDQILSYNRVYEEHLKTNQNWSKSNPFQFSNTLFRLLASLVVLEVTKYLTGFAVPSVIGKYLSLNIETLNLKTHHLLKLPYCEICKPQLNYHLAPWLESVTLK